MKKIIIIRHSKASMEGLDKERILDQDGLIQANSLAEKLSQTFDLKNGKFKIFSSPFKRAVQTIEPFIKNNHLNFKIVESLREIKIGKSKELSKHEIIKKMWQDKNFSVSGGESQNSFIDSIRKEINEILEEFYKNNYNYVFVTHGNTIGILLNDFFSVNFSFESWKNISMPDLYILNFDDNNNIEGFERNNKDIEKIFYIKK